MKLLIIRHGAPDYERDTLTAQGWREAQLLSDRLIQMRVDRIYCSPLGRAQDTALPTIQKTGIQPVVLDWLREFDRRMPGDLKKDCPWHLPPSFWASRPEYLNIDQWDSTEPYLDSALVQSYREDGAALDRLLAEFGYIRNGVGFDILPEFRFRNETIALFCHLGKGLALLSYLLHIPLPLCWHVFWLPTSSVTEIFLERHPQNRDYAVARCGALSSVSHLDGAGVTRCTSGLLMPLEGITEDTQLS